MTTMPVIKLPQHYNPPLSDMAQVWTTPAASWYAPICTSSGTLICPTESSPQHLVYPMEFILQVCARPHTALFVPDEKPNGTFTCYSLLLPRHTSLPEARMRQVWKSPRLICLAFNLVQVSGDLMRCWRTSRSICPAAFEPQHYAYP